jgi:hypothetical protein
MTNDEKHARRVIQIMKDAGVDAGELMNRTAIEAAWLKLDNAVREELLAGLQYAGDCNWIENGGGAFLRLMAKGADLK